MYFNDYNAQRWDLPVFCHTGFMVNLPDGKLANPTFVYWWEPKSEYKGRAVMNFHGTHVEIWSRFGPIGNTVWLSSYGWAHARNIYIPPRTGLSYKYKNRWLRYLMALTLVAKSFCVFNWINRCILRAPPYTVVYFFNSRTGFKRSIRMLN